MREQCVGRSMATAALLAAILLGAAACAGDRGRADAVDASARELAALRLATTVALPAALPPGLESIQPATGDGLPLVSFYSTNEPLVTVCTGRPDRCATLTTPRAILRRMRAGPATVLVTVDRSEAPEDAPPLSAALRRFWSNVDLTTSAPAWLAAG